MKKRLKVKARLYTLWAVVFITLCTIVVIYAVNIEHLFFQHPTVKDLLFTALPYMFAGVIIIPFWAITSILGLFDLEDFNDGENVS